MRRRRRPQRPRRGRVPRAGREVGARARAPRAARRRLHARAAVRRPGLHGQPVRVRRRPARPAGHRRARPAPPRLQGVRRRPEPLVPVRRRHATYAQFPDPERTAAGMRENGFSDADIKGQFAYEDIFDRHAPARCARAPATPGSATSPAEAELDELLGHDPELIDVLFEASIADVVERYVERRAAAAPRSYGQGVIGAWAGPRDSGHRVDQADALRGHARRRADGVGLRRGRHGPDLVRDRAKPRARPAPCSRPACPSPRSVPGEGVVLEGGELDPGPRPSSRTPTRRRTGRLLGDARRAGVPARIDGVAHDEPGDEGQLRAVPAAPLHALPDADWPHRAMVSITTADRRHPAGVRGLHPRDPVARASPSCTSRPRTTRRSRRRASTR